MQRNQNLTPVTAETLQRNLATSHRHSEPCDLLKKQQSALQLTKATERLMATLLPTLTAYHPTFASQYCGSDEQTQAMMAQYAECLLDEHIDAQGLQRGLMALKRRAATERFAPNPAEFAVMCKPAPAELGLPSFDAVYLQIVERNGACAGQGYEFSHPLTKLISMRKGALIRELTGMAFERVIRTEYDAWVKRLQAGEQLPEPHAALPDHTSAARPAWLAGVTPTTKLAQRAAENAAIAAARREGRAL